ncbi:MAG: hypothetical protein KC443_17710, partial [Anaerolineales bacterium]|nr:hypothetical protein [Anaerolineales bacterium]
MSGNQLLLIDTTQTQRYIFGSNRLMENIGGSYLVAMATEQWVLETIVKNGIEPHNIRQKADKTYEINPDRYFEDGLAVEVITAGGGNSILLCRDKTVMKTFLRLYSHRLLRDAPNIPVYTAHEPFDWSGTQKLAEAVGKLMGETANKAKQMQQDSQPLLGVGVSVPCKATGLPAVQMSKPVGDTPPYPISAEIAAKHAVADQKNENLAAITYLKKEVPINEDHYRYPGDFDDMVSRKGEANYIAIVHADGDGVGSRLKTLGKGKDWDNRTYITERRKFSDGLKAATRQALQATIKSLQDKLLQDSKPNGDVLIAFYGDEEQRIELQPIEEGKYLYYLPFRPIISGGDDVTFVCDGRIAHALTLNYLRAFKQATNSIKTEGEKVFDKPISASAGIAIVRTHYPFARAYDLAEDLMENAKRARRFNKWKEEEIGALDWHFTVGGLYGDVRTIREREYKGGSGDLTLRPVAIEKPKQLSERR